MNLHGPIEAWPAEILGGRIEQALLFKRLATLQMDAPLFASIDALRWNGPTDRFSAWTPLAEAPALEERIRKVCERMA